jgi:hypothetical protein
MNRSNQIGVICPFFTAKKCLGLGSETFMSIQDLYLFLSTCFSTEESSEEALNENEMLKLKQWIEDYQHKAHQDVFNKQSRSYSTLSSCEQDKTYEFITSTTKACPKCQFRCTHWHGHSCHHIQPGGGCPNCQEPFCYKCLSSGKDNLILRGTSSQCACGGWSNFCSNSNMQDNLVISPYPYDKVLYLYNY